MMDFLIIIYILFVFVRAFIQSYILEIWFRGIGKKSFFHDGNEEC